MFQRTLRRILRYLGNRSDTALLFIGFVLAVLFFVVLYLLAADAKLMPGLTRAGNLNFDVDIGELIFGVLGGGAAVWAAKTFASRGGPDGSRPEGAKSSPRRPDRGGEDPVEFKALLNDIYGEIGTIRTRLDALIDSRQPR